jgi:hypothetical protein
MDILGKIEAYLPEGKVEYDIEDGEIFTEEDYESLTEQGEFDGDNDDDKHMHITEDVIKKILDRNYVPKSLIPRQSSKPKSRKVRRKLAAQSRKINRSK